MAADCGARLLTGSEDGSVKLWTDTGELCAHVRHARPVHSVAFAGESPSLFCSGSLDGTASVWDDRGEQALQIVHGSGVRSVCWARGCVWTADLQGYAKCTSVAGGSELVQWQAHEAAVASVAFTECLRPTLLTAARDGQVLAWDADQVQSICCFNADSRAVNSLSTQGALVAAGGVDAIIRIFDLRSERCMLNLGSGTNWDRALRQASDVSRAKDIVFATDGHAFAVTGVCFASERYLASSGADRAVLVWDFRHTRRPVRCTGHELAALNVASVAGRIFSSSDDLSVREWDLEGGPVQVLPGVHDGPVFALAAAEVDQSRAAAPQGPMGTSRI